MLPSDERQAAEALLVALRVLDDLRVGPLVRSDCAHPTIPVTATLAKNTTSAPIDARIMTSSTSMTFPPFIVVNSFTLRRRPLKPP